MQLKYTGDAGRYYPRYGITPEPGQTYELPEDPADGLWAVISEPKTAKEVTK